MFRSPNSSPSRQQQRGAALVVAIFIITVMAILAAVIARVLSTAASSSVDEVYGIRAYQAATSGAQVFGHELIGALEADDDSSQICNAGLDNLSFSAPGLQQCSASVSCQRVSHDQFDITQYQITSTGRCISAGQNYSRVLSVEVVDGQL